MYIEPNAPALSSPSLIIEALLRDALTAREAADLLGDLRPIQRPRVALGDLAATIRAVRAARCLASACGQARITTQADYDRDSRRTIPALIVDLERIGEQLELGSMLRMTLGTAQGYARDAQRSLNRGGVLVDVGGR